MFHLTHSGGVIAPGANSLDENLLAFMKPYTPTANVREPKSSVCRFWLTNIHALVEMFAGEKCNPGLLTNQNDVVMWMMSVVKFAISEFGKRGVGEQDCNMHVMRQ